MEEIRNKETLGRGRRRRWVDNSKMDLIETGTWWCLDLSGSDRDKRRTPVNTVIKIWYP